MRAEDLVFWIDVLPDFLEDGAGVLCLRHADSMVVPRGWTLDDLRDPDLHLFRPPLPAPTLRTKSPRPSRGHAISEQLRFGEDTDRAADPGRNPDPDPADLDAADLDAADLDAADPDAADPDAADPDAADPDAADPDAADPDRHRDPGPEGGPWTPSFDEADDLDGLLSARSPLLSRAFRTAERSTE